jgi:hypothetical protein
MGHLERSDHRGDAAAALLQPSAGIRLPDRAGALEDMRQLARAADCDQAASLDEFDRTALKGQGREGRETAGHRYRPLRGRRTLTGRSGASGFQPAMVRAHSRAPALSAMPGNNRRSSTEAENSPPRSNAARIAAASASVTTNIVGAWDRGEGAASERIADGRRR